MNTELKRKIGQMLLAGFPSPQVDEQATTLINEFYVGNFALFARNLLNARQINALCRDLNQRVYEHNGIAPIISTDQEGGIVSRAAIGSALIPGAMSIAASPEQKAYELSYSGAVALGALGINANHAPVLDVNMDPMNPIIGCRSFSDDTETVCRVGVDALRGWQDGGIIAAVKHYPGHGNVNSDSHLGVPHNTSTRQQLEEQEWICFRKAFESGADALMTCHVVFDQVDPDRPGTISKKIMTELLRDDMGFKGVAITDCMEMGAIKDAYGIGPGAVMAIEAGCDILCFSHTLEAVSEAANAIYEAVESSRISEERIEQSYQRIIALKTKYNLLTPPQLSEEAALKALDSEEGKALAAKHSLASMTLMWDKGGLEALRNAKKPRFFAPASFALTGAEDQEKIPVRISPMAAERFGGDSYVIPLNELDEETCAAIEDPSYDVAVLGLYNARFRPNQEAILHKLEKDGRPLIVLLLGAPYDVSLIEKAECVITAYEYTALSAVTLLDAIERNEFTGKLPVKV